MLVHACEEALDRIFPSYCFAFDNRKMLGSVDLFFNYHAIFSKKIIRASLYMIDKNMLSRYPNEGRISEEIWYNAVSKRQAYSVQARRYSATEKEYKSRTRMTEIKSTSYMSVFIKLGDLSMT